MPLRRMASLAGIFGIVKAHHYVALCSKVVHLVRLDVVDEMANLPGGYQIAIVQKQTRVGGVWVYIDMVESLGVKSAGPANNTVDFVSF